MTTLMKHDWNRPTTKSGLEEMGKLVAPALSKALPAFMKANAERMLRCLYTECTKTPALLNCKPSSLFGALIQVAQLGLELGGPAGQAYLIPFKNDATLIIGYKGYIQLAHRSSVVQRITPRIVRVRDQFDIEYGSHQRLVHKPVFTSEENPVMGYYTVIETTNGGIDFEFMTAKEAEQHRDRFAMNKRDSGPWTKDFDSMALKTTIRKIAKRMPVSTEMVQAATLDEMADEGISQNLDALPFSETATPEQDLRDRLDAVREPGGETE